jgi:hypothetical protein
MQHVTPRSIRQHIRRLQAHLARENPILLEVVKSFRTLDGVAYRLGIQDRNESLTTRVPWWPMIAVLGTFSSGKSTFINSLLGEKLQLTGNQAVDDRFTVIVHAGGDDSHTLPGRALDADPRFPFFQMSRQHIIDLSDLVLVFFDARHPEPGAMQDTLEHLVSRTIHRPDSSKFLFVLNQIDNAAREDNPEEVFGAWQRALANKGLTAGRFYAIYDPDAALPIEDPKLRERFESKRAQDMAAIEERIDQVEVERAYRIIGVLEHTAQTIQKQVVPRLREARDRWKRRVLWLDGIVFSVLAVAAVAWSITGGHWNGLRLDHPVLTAMTDTPLGWSLFLGGIALVALSIHLCLRQVAAQSVLAGLEHAEGSPDLREWVVRAFRRNTRVWRPLLGRDPPGYGRMARRRLSRVLNDADRYVQDLNNRFADPSGGRTARRAQATPQTVTPAATDVSVVKSLSTATRSQ